MGRRYVVMPRVGEGRSLQTNTHTDTRAVLNEIERDSALRSQQKQEKAKAPATSSPITKAVPVAGPKAEPAAAQEPAKGRTAYFF